MHTAIKNSELKNGELKKSEERYRSVVATVKDYAIYTIDIEGYITSWNEGAERIKGYCRDEVVGKHYSLFFTESEICGLILKRLSLSFADSVSR